MRVKSFARRARIAGRLAWFLPGLLILSLFLSACSDSGKAATGSPTPGSGSQGSFPTTAPTLRVPQFGEAGQVAPTIKVLASIAPSLIVQIPLVPSGIKSKFPDATGLVTVIQGNPELSVFDTVTVDVEKMPPDQK